MKMRRTHRRINIRRMAKNYPRLPISMSSLPFSPFNFTYIWYLPLTLRLQYTDNIFNAGNFTLSLTFSICIIAMPHPQGKLNFPRMGPLSKSWLRPTATCHQIVVESTSTLKTCIRNHDWGPISSKSCALLGHQLSTHLLIEFYMISSTTWRSNQTSILSHGNHSPSYSSIFPPSQFGSSPSDPRIRSPRSAHLDDNFLARPYSALSSTRQTLSAQPLISSAISKLDHYW